MLLVFRFLYATPTSNQHRTPGTTAATPPRREGEDREMSEECKHLKGFDLDGDCYDCLDHSTALIARLRAQVESLKAELDEQIEQRASEHRINDALALTNSALKDRLAKVEGAVRKMYLREWTEMPPESGGPFDATPKERGMSAWIGGTLCAMDDLLDDYFPAPSAPEPCEFCAGEKKAYGEPCPSCAPSSEKPVQTEKPI